jgi:hypothetical protein
VKTLALDIRWLNEETMKSLMSSYTCALLLFFARMNSFGNPYYHQEPIGDQYSNPGAVVSYWQFVGVRFQLDEPVQITSVQAEIGYSSSTFFAALIPLATMDGLPQGSPFETNEVLYSKLFDSTAPSIPFDVTVGPGIYGLVFGAGLFGSGNSIGAMDLYQRVPGSTGFVWTTDGPPGTVPWHDSGLTFNVSIEGVVVPEPSFTGVLSLGAGIWVFGCYRLGRCRPIDNRVPCMVG